MEFSAVMFVVDLVRCVQLLFILVSVELISNDVKCPGYSSYRFDVVTIVGGGILANTVF